MKHRIFLLAIIFLSSAFILGQLGRISLTPDIALIAFDFILGIIVTSWFVMALFTKRERLVILYRHPLFRPFFIFFAICSISLIFNSTLLSLNELLVAFLYLVRLVIYYLAFFIVYELNPLQKMIVHKAMIISGAIIVVLGYVQLLVYPDLRNLIYLGWDDHYYRMVSVFMDPNFTGLFLVLYLLFIGKKWSDAHKNGHKRLRYLLMGLALVTFVAIFLTYSRTALLALLGGCGVYLFLIKRVKYLVIIGLIGLIFTVTLANTKYESLNPLRTASIQARFLAADNAVTIIQHHPIFGVGFNAYRYAQERYNLTGESIYPHHGEAGTDNSFLFITATTGIIGLVAFLYYWFEVGKWIRRNELLLASLAVILIGSFFINALFYTFLLFWIMVLLGTTQKSGR